MKNKIPGIYCISLLIAVFMIGGCSNSSDSDSFYPVPVMKTLKITETNFNKASGNLELTTNAPENSEVTITYGKSTISKNVTGGKILFPVFTRGFVDEDTDGGKSFKFILKNKSFSNSVKVPFTYYPEIQVREMKKYTGYVSAHSKNITPELVFNYNSEFLNISDWKYYLSDTYVIDEFDEDGKTPLTDISNEVSKEENIGKIIVGLCNIKVSAQTNIDLNYNAQWIVLDEQKADSVEIQSASGYYYYPSLKDAEGNTVSGAGSCKWFTDDSTEPVSTDIFYELRKEDIGKKLRLKYTQDFENQQYDFDAETASTLKAPIVDINLIYNGDIIVQGEKIFPEAIRCSFITDCFDNEVSNAGLVILPSVRKQIYTIDVNSESVPFYETTMGTAEDWETLTFNSSTVLSVFVKGNEFDFFETKLYIPVKSVLTDDTMPVLSTDVENISAGKVMFENTVNTRKLVCRIGESENWIAIPDGEFTCAAGKKIYVKIAESGSMETYNYVGESDPREIEVTTENVGTKVVSGVDVNVDSKSFKLEMNQTSKNVFEFTVVIPESKKELFKREAVVYDWSVDYEIPSIKDFLTEEANGKKLIIDASSWLVSKYQVNVCISVNGNLQEICQSSFSVKM